MRRSYLLILPTLLLGCGNGEIAPKAHEQQNEPKKPADTRWIGKWDRIKWQNDASINISDIKGDSIKFSLFASSGGHTGELEGAAIVNDGIAFFQEATEYDTCIIKFTLSGDTTIIIDQISGFCSAAMGVDYSGEYKNKKVAKATSDEDLFSLGILTSKIQDSTFRGLVDDRSYQLFVNSSQLGSEERDLDGLRTTVQAYGVRGLFTYMENIIMIDSNNTIYAAVIDDSIVRYFTNNNSYKDKLPRTIESWRKNFAKLPILYCYKEK